MQIYRVDGLYLYNVMKIRPRDMKLEVVKKRNENTCNKIKYVTSLWFVTFKAKYQQPSIGNHIRDVK